MKTITTEKKNMFFYLTFIFLGLFTLATFIVVSILFLQFKVEYDRGNKIIDCITDTDILLKKTNSIYSSELKITKNIYKADYVMRNGKQINVKDICLNIN